MTLPAIETRPARTSCSTARRDPSPAPLKALLSRTGSAPEPEAPPGPDTSSGCLRPRSRRPPLVRTAFDFLDSPPSGAERPPGPAWEPARVRTVEPERLVEPARPVAPARVVEPWRPLELARPVDPWGDGRAGAPEARPDRASSRGRTAAPGTCFRVDRRPRACPPPAPAEPSPAESSQAIRVDRLAAGSPQAARAEPRPRACPPGGRDERRGSGASRDGRDERGADATRCEPWERGERGPAGSAPDRCDGRRVGAGCWPPPDRDGRRGGDPDPDPEPGGRGRLPSPGVRFRPAEVMAAPGARPGRCHLGGSP